MNRKQRRKQAKDTGKRQLGAGGASGSPERAFTAAANYYQQGRLEEAESALLEIQRQQPGIPDVLHLLALIGLQTDKADEAVNYLETAISAMPESAELFNLLGGAFRRADRGEDAIAAYQQAVRLDPNLPDAHYNFGNALKAMDRWDEAVSAYQQAVGLKPDFADAYYNLALALKADRRLDEATAANRKVLSLKPNDADAHYTLGNLFQEQEKFDDSVFAYKNALAIRPGFREARSKLGNALRLSGRLDDADECYRELVAEYPGDADALAEFGKILYLKGELPEAIENSQQALALDPDNTVFLALNGYLLFENQDFVEARRCLNLAATDPNFEYAKHCFFGEEYRTRAAPERFDELVSRLPEMTGTYPNSSGTGPVVMTSCDHGYFQQYGLAFALSLDRYAPGHDLHLHVINPGQLFGDEIAGLKKHLGDTMLTVTTETAPNADKLYFSAVRFIRLCQILEETGRDFLHLDTDSLAQKPFASISTIDDAADLVVPTRFNEFELRLKVLISSLFVRHRPLACRFMRRFGAYLADRIFEKKLVWYVDQTAFYITHRMMEFDGEAVSLAPLPQTLCDFELGSNSEVWAAKGDLKEDKEFKQESTRLLEAAYGPGR
ncbi:MAG: tetratricopeptide repeat protein [Rhodospirillales bacterium]|nr:tetratricopeptide repeat protein [Rhodospirillales bacterium]